MTKSQIIAIHTAKNQLMKSAGLDDAWYRETLRIAGGVTSSTKLSNAGFERVMAAFEGMGFRDTQQKAGERPADYWRNRSNMRDLFASTQQVFEINRLGDLVDGYSVAGLCRRFSHERTEQPSKLRPHEARQLIEMLKAVQARTIQEAP